MTGVLYEFGWGHSRGDVKRGFGDEICQRWVAICVR